MPCPGPAPAPPRPADPYPIPPLNDIFDQKIAICQLLGPDVRCVWESTQILSQFCFWNWQFLQKKNVFLFYQISRLKGQKNAQTDL